MGKLLKLVEARLCLQELQNQGKNIVLTNGCFDLLHIGHVRLLAKAKELGDYLVVAVNSDQSIIKLKGPGRPIICEEDRLEMLASLEVVDFLILFDELSPIEVINTIHPNIFVKGSGYIPEKLPEYLYVTQFGGRVITFGTLSPLSTSSIIARIKSIS